METKKFNPEEHGIHITYCELDGIYTGYETSNKAIICQADSLEDLEREIKKSLKVWLNFHLAIIDNPAKFMEVPVGQWVILPITEEEIEKQFPLDVPPENLTKATIRNVENMARREGARWAIKRMKGGKQ